MDVNVRAVRQPWTDAVELAVLVPGERVIGKLVMEPMVAGEVIVPTMRITNDAAQLLMDELWRCGLRPSEGSGSAGSLAATERHLQDMRRLTFGAIAELREWDGAPCP